MVLISYDISDDKKRAKFNRFIRKYGIRLQFSVYEIKNSEKILENILTEIKNKYSKVFDQSDSVYVFKLGSNCDIIKYGYPQNEDKDYLII